MILKNKEKRDLIVLKFLILALFIKFTVTIPRFKLKFIFENFFKIW